MGARLRVEVFPADLDTSADFYTRVLGFTVARDERTGTSPYLALVLGDVHLGAAPGPTLTAQERAARRPLVGVELVVEVDDLDAARARVAAYGWPVVEDVTARPWGGSGLPPGGPRRVLLAPDRALTEHWASPKGARSER